MLYNHYALCEPDCSNLIAAIRYIGRTSKDIQSRYNDHLDGARKHIDRSSHKLNWIRSLFRRGLVPVLIDLGLGDEERERELIAWAKSVGCKLTNLTNGGEGGMEFVPEVIERLRVIGVEKANLPGARNAVSEATTEGMLRFWAKPSTREKMATSRQSDTYKKSAQRARLQYTGNFSPPQCWDDE